MEVSTERKEMLDLMLQPALWVEDGIIRHINPSAAPLLLSEGQPIGPMILTGEEEYAQFSDGCLHLDLCIAGQVLAATVIHRDGGDIFLPETGISPGEFQMFSLAAMQMRKLMAGLMATTERIFPGNDTKSVAQANHRLHQLLRVIDNMSDAKRFCDSSACRWEPTEICAFLEEILEKADTLLSNIDIRIHSQIPNERIYTLLDREQIERALYNLLSNAAKYSGSGCDVSVQLTHRGQKLYLSVQSSNPPLNSIPIANYCSQYLREPSIEDPSKGLGLGMVLVRAAASNHGGTVLIDQPDGKGTRITMSLAIRLGKGDMVRSPIVWMDYASERDHGLLELSDVLPAELYAIE